MATLVTFWKFAKRLNSTALPSPDLEKEEWYVTFKERTSILLLKLECHNQNVKNMNYIHIPLYERYYWIRDVETIANNTYVLTCECDVLGTFGAQVLGQSIYMSYASFGFNDLLDDPRVSPTVGYDYTVKMCDLSPIIDSATPNLMYETISLTTENGELGGITIFQGKGIPNLYINSVMAIDSASDLLRQLQGQNLLSPIGGIWLTPFNIYYTCTSTAIVNHDVWGISMGGRAITDVSLRHYAFKLDVPQTKYSDFRMSGKYLEYTLYLPLVGCVNIPAALIVNYRSIMLEVTADAISGEISYSIRLQNRNQPDFYLGCYAGKARVDIPIGVIQNQDAKVATSLLGAAVSYAGGVATGAVMGGAVGATIGGLAGMAVGATSVFATSATPPNINNLGNYSGGLASLGSLIGDGCKAQIVMAQSDSTSEPSSYTSYSGRPCQRVQPIQKGYCQSPQPSVTFAGKLEEIEAFNNALRSGVYFE